MQPFHVHFHVLPLLHNAHHTGAIVSQCTPHRIVQCTIYNAHHTGCTHFHQLSAAEIIVSQLDLKAPALKTEHPDVVFRNGSYEGL